MEKESFEIPDILRDIIKEFGDYQDIEENVWKINHICKRNKSYIAKKAVEYEASFHENLCSKLNASKYNLLEVKQNMHEKIVITNLEEEKSNLNMKTLNVLKKTRELTLKNQDIKEELKNLRSQNSLLDEHIEFLTAKISKIYAPQHANEKITARNERSHKTHTLRSSEALISSSKAASLDLSPSFFVESADVDNKIPFFIEEPFKKELAGFSNEKMEDVVYKIFISNCMNSFLRTIMQY